VSVVEGNSGSKAVTFTVSLSQAAGSTVTVKYATANGSATAGQDYTAVSGTVTFTAGQISKQVSVTVLGDTAAEADETFSLTLSAPSGASLGAVKTSTVTITNDDLPTVSISPVSVSVVEGNSGSKAVTFTVSLSQAAGSTVTVGYATANGSATAGQDYTAASGTVTFTAGQTSQQVSVTVAGDAAIEADETFTLTLSAPLGASLGAVKTSTVTITNDDLPAVSISPVSVSVAEGNSGSKAVTFTVSLSQSAGSTVTVRYATANGSATAGQDYTAASGTLTFTIGQTSKQVSVTVLGDRTVEADETLTLTLSAPTGAVLGAGKTATVTITNDDKAVAAKVVPPTPLGANLAVSDGQTGLRPEFATQTLVVSTLRKKAAA
jgi:chitinase